MSGQTSTAKDYSEHNIILVRESIKLYHRHWIDRNLIAHDPEIHKLSLIKENKLLLETKKDDE